VEEKYFYDNSSIAARCKREHLMKEAEEHRLRRHIAALQKLKKEEKTSSPDRPPKYVVPPEINPHPLPGH
jgi:hypothetical protein